MFLKFYNRLILVDKIESINKKDFKGDELYRDTYEVILIIGGEDYVYSFDTEEERDNVYNKVVELITKNHEVVEII